MIVRFWSLNFDKKFDITVMRWSPALRWTSFHPDRPTGTSGTDFRKIAPKFWCASLICVCRFEIKLKTWRYLLQIWLTLQRLTPAMTCQKWTKMRKIQKLIWAWTLQSLLGLESLSKCLTTIITFSGKHAFRWLAFRALPKFSNYYLTATKLQARSSLVILIFVYCICLTIRQVTLVWAS